MKESKESDHDTETPQNDSNSPSQVAKKTTNKPRTRPKKRKRDSSESSNENILPENTLEMENNLQAAALKNNLDDASVKKILKKVVTNDHVLALVKLREEAEESGMDESKLTPKLTRAKAKELMRVSPKPNAPWNLDNLELTPINHIPVKTRPEVKALIAQDLPEDEDDDEYQPAHDEALSDEDHTDMSCSDIESQPRTPATPASVPASSPLVLKDGPFVVPQDIKPPTCRKLQMEEEKATIALRTRSKLSLSATSIEHIESSFVPPDEVPLPIVDDLWNQFLEECLNPALSSRHEDDDETDPEYSVAADPDAHEEDEEALENSIIKISKKELNDLVTELFHIMPEDLEKTSADLVSSASVPVPRITVWKQEPMPDEDKADRAPAVVSKVEPLDDEDPLMIDEGDQNDVLEVYETGVDDTEADADVRKSSKDPTVSIHVEEGDTVRPPECGRRLEVPPLLRDRFERAERTKIVIEMAPDDKVIVLPEQRTILQQQLRQHIQLSAATYLQLYIHPKYWTLAHSYKEYLEAFNAMVEKDPHSVAGVCNLKPAIELVASWESSVSENTPENMAFVEYLQNDISKSKRAMAQNRPYIGDFHETFKQVIANSNVFLYPHLLPPIPYRTDNVRKSPYCRSEDELLAIGLDQFWQYIEDNPDIYKPNKYRKFPNPRHRWGFTNALVLVCKHMFPWTTPRHLANHIAHLKKLDDKENPVIKFLNNREITPVKHALLPFNPNMTLYQQELLGEMPALWLRYIAKTSKRASLYLRNTHQSKVRLRMNGITPKGSAIEMGKPVNESKKRPLPDDFTKKLTRSHRRGLIPLAPKFKDNFSIQVTPLVTTTPDLTGRQNLFSFVKTGDGGFFVPVVVQNNTTTVNSLSQPITTAVIGHDDNKKKETEINKRSNGLGSDREKSVKDTKISELNASEKCINSDVKEIEAIEYSAHCKCCERYRKIRKMRQKTLLEYIKSRNVSEDSKCPCNSIEMPKISKRFRLLVNRFQSQHSNILKDLDARMSKLKGEVDNLEDSTDANTTEDMATVTAYQLKLLSEFLPSNSSVIRRLINFNSDTDSPTAIAKEIQSHCFEDFVELSKEFLCFLTPMQADELGSFRDYFVWNCVPGLLKRMDAEITDDKLKLRLTQKLRDICESDDVESCEMCCDLLQLVRGYHSMAHYLFNLFPHRTKIRKPQTISQETAQQSNNIPSQQDSVKSQNSETTLVLIETTTLQIVDTNTPQTVETKTPKIVEKTSSSQIVEKTTSQIVETTRVVAATINEKTAVEVAMNEEMDCSPNRPSTPVTRESSQVEDLPEDEDAQNHRDYEADRSSDDDDDDPDDPPTPVKCHNTQISPFISLFPCRMAALVNTPNRPTPFITLCPSIADTAVVDINAGDIKQETTEPASDSNTQNLLISKTELQDYDSTSDMSMMIMSEDEVIKTESIDWKKDEDKIILEVLKECLKSEDRRDLTNVLQILEETEALKLLTDSLVHRSRHEIRARVWVLLDLIVLSEKSVC